MVKQIFIGFLATLIVAFLCSFIYHFLDAMDLLKSEIIAQHSPGPCITLEGTDGGSEDLIKLPDGRVLVTSGLYQQHKGKILLFDFLDPTHAVKELKIEGNINMSKAHFHGLSIWKNEKTGILTLAVVNHPRPDDDAVELFTFDEKRHALLHKKTVKDPLFSSLNDVVLVNEDQFYVTCDIKYDIKEIFLLLKLGKVVFFDGTSSKVVVSNMFVPNGINISPDSRFLYVAEMVAKQIVVFERNQDNGLQLIQKKFVDTGVDNIEVDFHTGDLWIGAHPRVHIIVEYVFEQGEIIAPSQVLKITPVDGKLGEVIEIYLNDGKEISASAIATEYKGRLLIGSVSSSLLLCDIKYKQ